ncbi:MAG: hypothetical protein U9N43_04830 [Euryarchaeota archaeon]|nr:hypothetical protein [Euryarchaeota archaeon]
MKADPELAVRTVANKFPVEMEGFSNLSAILLIDGVAGLGERIMDIVDESYLCGIKCLEITNE